MKPPGVAAAAIGTTAAAPVAAQRLVAWEARAPPGRVFLALQRLRPSDYPSVSAAKKAVRRRQILVDGKLAESPSLELAGGELLQCVQRVGGIAQLDWDGRPLGAAGSGGGSGAAGGQQAILPLQVIYEDDHMACVVKPPGVPVDTPPGRSAGSSASLAGSEAGGSEAATAAAAAAAPAAKAPPPAAPSVYSRLARSLAPSTQLGALRRPRHCHRLDEPTGGLLLVGKTQRAQAALCGAFHDRQVQKRYTALVWGRLEGRGRVTWVLDGRLCDTEYAAVRRSCVDLRSLAPAGSSGRGSGDVDAAHGSSGSETDANADGSGGGGGSANAGGSSAAAWVTTVDLWPHTGRKHQLRRHMALLGHPLVGDPRYTFGYAAARLAAGQTLPPEGHQPVEAAPAEAAAGEAAGEAVSAAAACAAACAAAARAACAAAADAAVDLPAVVAAATAAHRLKLCLWAVELHLPSHPATGEPLHCCIPEPPAFAAVRAALAGEDVAAVVAPG